MKNFAKITALMLIVMSLAFLVCACSNSQNAQDSISVSVKISTTDKIIIEETAALSQSKTAAAAINTVCGKNKVEFDVKAGMYDGFGGIFSTPTDGWLLYVNGTLAETGAQDAIVADGDVVEFKYENYDEAYKGMY